MKSHAFSRKDANHAELAGYYVQMGCSCEDTSHIGYGFPDAIVGCAGITDLVEFKSADGELEPSQIAFEGRWRGSPIWLIRKQTDVITHVQSMRSRARFRPCNP